MRNILKEFDSVKTHKVLFSNLSLVMCELYTKTSVERRYKDDPNGIGLSKTQRID